MEVIGKNKIRFGAFGKDYPESILSLNLVEGKLN